ncbi:MAG: hypothetical protein GY749_01065 [Desulfobacteraceae bacterium]|nr:hypothetical protein [Desulfobacteraceae bacterium]
MGKHHFYHKLQSYGIKLAKFKQEVLISELIQKQELTKEQQTVVANHGACAALCCMWLYIRLNEMKTLKRSKSIKIENNINLPFAKIGVALQYKYMEGFKPENWEKITTNMYNEFELKLKMDSAWHSGPENILGKGADVLPWRPGVLISLDLSKGSGHSIAMCRIKGRDYFFDPSVGEYQVTDLKKFLKEYLKAFNTARRNPIRGGHRISVSKR